MQTSITLRCSACGRTVEEDHRCPDGDADLEFVVDEARAREALDLAGSVDGLWDFAPLLPTGDVAPVTLGEGGTPLVPAATLGDEFDVDLSLKLEGGNPSGSTKDRGSSVVLTRAAEQGAEVVACASTGNAAASTAAYAARSGLECCLFVPADAPEAKAVQPLVYGADVLAVEGSYDDAHALCRAVTDRRGWLDRSAGGSPYTRAGERTLGYELACQADPVPDWLVVPMGNGGTIAGAWDGFATFADIGLVDGTPRMLGVQAEGASAIYDAVHDSETARGEASTCADSIAVGTPHRLADARDAVRESGGTAVQVTDEAIRSATARLGRTEGVFAEPACGAAIAGLAVARERGVVDAGDDVVAVMTGTGLKDTATAAAAVGAPETVPVDADPADIAARYDRE